MKNGIQNKVIHMRRFICDTPARCHVRQTKLYSGYYGCDKCTQKGTYTHGRMTYPHIGCAARTDVSFRERLNTKHHTGDSPLEELGIGMCSSFPLEYMHLCLLGCMKKLLLLWLKSPHSVRIGSNDT